MASENATLLLLPSSPSSPNLNPTALSDTTTFLHGLIEPFTLIIFSEIGDKTFLIAAILAMRHPGSTVFLGAVFALLIMSVLSAGMGHLLPVLVPKHYTQFAAALLFVVFGIKMWVEARRLRGGCEKIQEEMKEAEEEIEEDETALANGSVGSRVRTPLGQLGKGLSFRVVAGRLPSPAPKKPRTSWSEGARNFCSLFLGPVFVQAFVLTLLGELGDRSQIATIALGAAENVYTVALGTIIGHACCTALAVIGGRYVSTKISVKHVTYGGSILFWLFGLIYFYEALSMIPDVETTIIISNR